MCIRAEAANGALASLVTGAVDSAHPGRLTALSGIGLDLAGRI